MELGAFTPFYSQSFGSTLHAYSIFTRLTDMKVSAFRLNSLYQLLPRTDMASFMLGALQIYVRGGAVISVAVNGKMEAKSNTAWWTAELLIIAIPPFVNCANTLASSSLCSTGRSIVQIVTSWKCRFVPDSLRHSISSLNDKRACHRIPCQRRRADYQPRNRLGSSD